MSKHKGQEHATKRVMARFLIFGFLGMLMEVCFGAVLAT